MPSSIGQSGSKSTRMMRERVSSGSNGWFPARAMGACVESRSGSHPLIGPMLRTGAGCRKTNLS